MTLIRSGSFEPGKFVVSPADAITISSFNYYALELPNVSLDSVQNRFIFVGFNNGFINNQVVYPVCWTDPVFFNLMEWGYQEHMNPRTARVGLYCISSLKGRGEVLDWNLHGFLV